MVRCVQLKRLQGLTGDDLFELKETFYRQRGMQGILLNPRNGGWAVVPSSLYRRLYSLSGKKIQDIRMKKSSDSRSLDRAIIDLYNLGLCNINSKSVVDNEYWNTYANEIPRLIIIKTTNLCNLACKYCYASGFREISRKCIEVGLVEKTATELVDLAKELPVHICFHGGEPLLFKDRIRKIVERIRALGMGSDQVEFSIQTNGTLLDKETIEFCMSNEMPVGISLDGPKEVNDAIRVFTDGKGTYKSVMERIALCNELGFDNISLLITVTSVNVSRLPEIVHHFWEKGLKHMKFTLFSTWGRGSLHRDLAPPPQDVVKAYKEILEMIKNKRLEGIFIESLSHYINNLVYFDRLYMCMRSPCGAGLSVLTLDVDGTIWACDCGLGDEAFRLGNIKQLPLARILNSGKRSKFANRVVQRIQPCNSCEWRGLCMGTCTHRSFISNGCFLSRDPVECYINREMFQHIIWQLYESPSLIERFTRYAVRNKLWTGVSI